MTSRRYWGAALVASVISTSLAAPLPGQATFEGTITKTVAAFPGHELTLWVKGTRFRSELPGPNGTMTMIGDDRGRMLMLMDAAKTYYAMPMSDAKREVPPTVTATTRSETVAGYPCRYYHLHRQSGTPADEDLCVTTALGYVRAGVAPGMDQQFISKTWPNGFLVLKSIDARGTVQSEVKRIEQKKVSDAVLSPPPGYSEMSMPGASARKP